MEKLTKLALAVGFGVMIVVPSGIAYVCIRAILDNDEWSKGSIATIIAEISIVLVLWLMKTLIAAKGGKENS